MREIVKNKGEVFNLWDMDCFFFMGFPTWNMCRKVATVGFRRESVEAAVFRQRNGGGLGSTRRGRRSGSLEGRRRGVNVCDVGIMRNNRVRGETCVVV